MDELRPIYLGGRIIGYKDAQGNQVRPGTLATSPRVVMKLGQARVSGGEPGVVAALAQGLAGNPVKRKEHSNEGEAPDEADARRDARSEHEEQGGLQGQGTEGQPKGKVATGKPRRR